MDVNTDTSTPPRTLTLNDSLDGLQDVFEELDIHEEPESKANLFLEFYQNSEEDMASTKDTMTKKTELNPPKPFTGKRTELQCFIQETFVFLTINKEHYNTDDKKITFVMLFMDDGDASIWKQEFISRIMKDDQGDDILLEHTKHLWKASRSLSHHMTDQAMP